MEAKAEAEAKAAAASVRYDKDRAKEMLKTSKLLDPKSKEYQEVCIPLCVRQLLWSH